MVFLGLRLFFLAILLGLSQVNAALITKVFYHHGRCEDKLVFYFDREQSLLRQDEVNGSVNYSFPGVQVSAQARAALDSLEISDNTDIGIKLHFDPAFIAKVQAYKFTPISAPYGIVIKIWHVQKDNQRSCIFKRSHKEIVLDFGHGGHDSGTKNGTICEKDIVRKVGLKLANILKNQGYVVHLTRLGDEFVPLDERTYFANLYTNASLFVSLHVNHAGRSEVRGIETHRMDSELLHSLDTNKLINYYDITKFNALLANIVHSKLIDITQNHIVIDRKVKRSVAQVLLGVEMPAILIELGFLSNTQEAQLLNSPAYQLQLAQGISKGINSYLLAA